MKVVLNGRYGGFSLSNRAMELLVVDVCGAYNIPRNDAKLVKVVEELGEEANGFCSNLYVEEYDGFESLVLIPIIKRETIENMSTDEILDYLESINNGNYVIKR